jgi:hypothetical protein
MSNRLFELGGLKIGVEPIGYEVTTPVVEAIDIEVGIGERFGFD